MTRNLVVFEQYAEDFGPLTLTRPVYAVRTGLSTLAEKLAGHGAYAGARLCFHARPQVAAVVPQVIYFNGIFQAGACVNDFSALEREGGLLVDGAVIASLSKMPAIEGPAEVGVVKQKITENGKAIERVRVVYARLGAEALRKAGSVDALLRQPESAGVPVREVGPEIVFAAFPWDLVINCGKAIEAEFRQLGGSNSHTPPGVVFRGPREGSFISTEADIAPGVVIDARGGKVHIAAKVEIQGSVALDARSGAIVIQEAAKIESGSLIQGPACIGPKNLIKQATVREGCAFGPVCRVGGEIEESIIIGYSNKQHLGFMGHAVVGEWVNWGAGTTNSDLKNDYSNVVVELSRGRRIDSGQNKTVGCYIGDHTKTALSTMLNTGTVLGVMSNILMNGVTEDKYIPSFCIYDNGRFLPNRTGLKTAETAMSRRSIPLTPEYRKVFEQLQAQLRDETREMARAAKKPELTAEQLLGVQFMLKRFGADFAAWRKARG